MIFDPLAIHTFCLKGLSNHNKLGLKKEKIEELVLDSGRSFTKSQNDGKLL